MLKRVHAVQFDRATRNGRTSPAFVTCECPDGSAVEVVAKFAGGCDEGSKNLAREVISACLAGDLGLPVPQPYLVEASPEWVETVPDDVRRRILSGGCLIGFGSRALTGQYAIWSSGERVSDAMTPAALGVFVFDAIIQNPDRRADNPNCFVRGDQIRIFDHEVAFTHELILFPPWSPPWVLGGLATLEVEGSHIFRPHLRRRALDYGSVREAWAALSDEKIADYEAAIPDEWAAASPVVASSLKLIRDCRDRIDAVLEEVRRVLS